MVTFPCNFFGYIQETLHIQEREKQRRLPAGTLVIGTCQFLGAEDGVSTYTVFPRINPALRIVAALE